LTSYLNSNLDLILSCRFLAEFIHNECHQIVSNTMVILYGMV
jgi:hypothetical protein